MPDDRHIGAGETGPGPAGAGATGLAWRMHGQQERSLTAETRVRAALLPLTLFATALPAGAESAAETVDALRARIEAETGRPVAIDPRLLATPCPEPHAVAWRGVPGQSLIVSCPRIGRQLVVPVAGSGGAGAAARGQRDILVRRGERVVVETTGPGFRISVEAVAEAAAAAGDRLVLRNATSGQRFQGVVNPDGRVTVAGR